MLEIVIDQKNGTLWDVSQLVSNATWKTSRIGKPSSLEITLIKGALFQDKNFSCNNGDIVRATWKGRPLFLGYIFSIGSGKDEAVTLTAYDQTRYLLANDTYVFKNVTATQVIKRIANDFGLKTGPLEDTQHIIPAMVEDNKKLMDIICKALDLTLIATTRNYILFDDFGLLTIRNINDMKVDTVLSDDSLMYDYEYNRSIDSDTYNRIKIVQDNKTTGRRDVYIYQDSETIARWGLLQYYDKADDNLNAAQITETLKRLIQLKNREARSIKLQAIGDIRIRAGCFIPVKIQEFEIDEYFLVDECQHHFESVDHTMTIELKVI